MAVVFDGIDYFGDVPQAHWRAHVTRDDEKLIFVSLEELIGVGNCPRLFGVGKRPLGKVGICGLQRLANSFQTDSVTIELGRVPFDAHRRSAAARRADLSDALD